MSNMYTYPYICIQNSRAYTYINTYICIYIYVYLHIHMYVYIDIYIDVCICTCVYNICIHIHIVETCMLHTQSRVGSMAGLGHGVGSDSLGLRTSAPRASKVCAPNFRVCHFWLFKGSFKVSSGPVYSYRSSLGTDFDISEVVSPELGPLPVASLLGWGVEVWALFLRWHILGVQGSQIGGHTKGPWLLSWRMHPCKFLSLFHNSK